MNESTSVSLFSSLEEVVRSHVRDFIEQIVEDELTVQLDRARYERGGVGYRNGHRERTLVTTFGKIELEVPRGRIQRDGAVTEFRSGVLPKGKKLTKNVEALVVATYLCGVSTRRCKVALCQALGPNVSRSTVSRCLETLKPEWQAWQARDLSQDGIVRLMLDGFVVKARLGKQTFRISVLGAMGINQNGQKVVLSFKGMGGESKEAWREVLDDLAARGVKQPQVCIIDGSKGLRAAVAELWPETLVQRCTVHKERNLLAVAPEPLHEEIKADYRELMYAPSVEEALNLRSQFVAKWKNKCPQVVKSFEEAGDELFTYLRFPPTQWKSLRTTNAIERLNEEFRRRVKVQGVQPSSEGVCMLLWALIASGATILRRVDGWETLSEKPKDLPLAA
jgi:putative transposase